MILFSEEATSGMREWKRLDRFVVTLWPEGWFKL